MSRTSGTAQDGIYTGTVTIPQGAAPGTWSAVLSPLTDTLGNSGSPGPPAGFPKTLTVAPTAPGAPAIGTATPANTSALVRWTAPTDNGGALITGYTIRTYRGAALTPGKTTTAAAGATSSTVTGLTNGIGYTFTVAATNLVGTSAESARSIAVTPATKPSVPTIGTPSAGNTSAVVRWTPASNGGSPITGYTIRTYRVGSTTVSKTTTAGAGATSSTITGMTNGIAYTFTVAATNALGTSAPSARSSAVIPATKPAAPRIGAASAGNASAVVRWTPPSNGGRPITGYTIRTYRGSSTTVSKTTYAGAAATSTTVTGLTNGVTYTFTVAATNAVGTGSPSARSAGVKPAAPRPANPGDAKNCTNFSTWQAAQSWFNTYYPYYGDVARLDSDNDRIACESLPGAP
jgi:titin